MLTESNVTASKQIHISHQTIKRHAVSVRQQEAEAMNGQDGNVPGRRSLVSNLSLGSIRKVLKDARVNLRSPCWQGASTDY